ncbi:hypothetical protein MMC30_003098 [Trapelia coarctata]|nr:hypothetical protein [Trapelia coarctata]
MAYTGPGGNATVQSSLPAASFEAVLPLVNFNKASGSNISGTVTGTSVAGGSGVTFSIDVKGLPDLAKYGPFIYHVHAKPVPSNGNCTGTLAHLDPTSRGETPLCDASAPETCQAGDLSGKHGNITANTWTVSYSDLYISSDPSSPYYYGDKSIVIHTNNKTRLTCANFTRVASTTTNATSTVVLTSPTATVTPFKGAAAKLGAGVVGGALAVMAAALL